LAPCGKVTLFGVLQTGQATLTFVSGISAEGSVTLETLKVFMQFVQSLESFHRAILSQPAPPSSIISNNLATADSVRTKPPGGGRYA
jgi:hypothetical protein